MMFPSRGLHLKTTDSFRRYCVALLLSGLIVPGTLSAFESDVHFGLTEWLALQAGFVPREAEALAIGNQRVDSGDMQFMDLVTAYGCLRRSAESSALVKQRHYPSAGPVPGPPEQRVVIAGSEPAQKAALAFTRATSAEAVYLLYKFAEPLHAVQDSWSHQGVPDVPRPLEGAIACDPTLAWAHPVTRGGWNSHKADLTHEWPADTLAMARATYDLLLKYPAIAGVKRSPKDWAQIQPLLDGFIRASSKSAKQRWFLQQGIRDVSFLEGVTLPDGAEPFDARWGGRKLPPLSTLQSTQHHIAADLLDFYSRFFIQWASTDDFDALAETFGAPPRPPGKAPAGSPAVMARTELAARLRVWRIRDHGRVADLAHALKALTAAQRAAIMSIAKDSKALARYPSPADAYFPLQIKGPEVEPLLGFVITMVDTSAAGNERAVAMAKLRHAPYDTLVVLAERMEDKWRVVSLGAVVDH
jgi:hypothetical protein